VTELAKSISQLVKPQGSIGMAFEEKVERIESIGMNYPQAPCPVIHRFGPGVYIREVKIPAGGLCDWPSPEFRTHEYISLGPPNDA
jgi:hypothetical protein